MVAENGGYEDGAFYGSVITMIEFLIADIMDNDAFIDLSPVDIDIMEEEIANLEIFGSIRYEGKIKFLKNRIEDISVDISMRRVQNDVWKCRLREYFDEYRVLLENIPELLEDIQEILNIDLSNNSEKNCRPVLYRAGCFCI